MSIDSFSFIDDNQTDVEQQRVERERLPSLFSLRPNDEKKEMSVQLSDCKENLLRLPLSLQREPTEHQDNDSSIVDQCSQEIKQLK